MILAMLSACGPNTYNNIDIMPAPTVFASGTLDPFENVTDRNFTDRARLFYATDREPAGPDDPQESYNNTRGLVLRTGVVEVMSDPPLETWERARQITLAAARDQTYSLRVEGVQETGIMPFSAIKYMNAPPSRAEIEAAGRRFAAQVNAQLSQSRNKDIFIYVHGYNVDFDYSTLVSRQLQHFLGYQGAFISFNWTATPNRLAYFRDQESALAARRYLRELIGFLSSNTNARRIHLIGYSAGSRLAFDTTYQITLGAEEGARLGKLVLIGSDLDRAYFIQAIEDGILDAVTDVTVYQSGTDSALAISRLVFGRKRLGETADPGEATPAVQAELARVKGLHVIDATDAEAASTGNGHWYFQSSPWASSDLFLSLLTDTEPAERGLVRIPGEVVWRFPDDYPDRIRGLGRLH
ncbi:alpha/beta hydrolase [Ruegeria pomeroyi]|nr:alpha/beta hydrolase [Ruegeria pomeroyi]